MTGEGFIRHRAFRRLLAALAEINAKEAHCSRTRSDLWFVAYLPNNRRTAIEYPGVALDGLLPFQLVDFIAESMVERLEQVAWNEALR